MSSSRLVVEETDAAAVVRGREPLPPLAHTLLDVAPRPPRADSVAAWMAGSPPHPPAVVPDGRLPSADVGTLPSANSPGPSRSGIFRCTNVCYLDIHPGHPSASRVPPSRLGRPWLVGHLADSDHRTDTQRPVAPVRTCLLLALRSHAGPLPAGRPAELPAAAKSGRHRCCDTCHPLADNNDSAHSCPARRAIVPRRAKPLDGALHPHPVAAWTEPPAAGDPCSRPCRQSFRSTRRLAV